MAGRIRNSERPIMDRRRIECGIGIIPVDNHEHHSLCRRNTLALAPPVDNYPLVVGDPEILGTPARVDPRLRSIHAFDNRPRTSLAVRNWVPVCGRGGAEICGRGVDDLRERPFGLNGRLARWEDRCDGEQFRFDIRRGGCFRQRFQVCGTWRGGGGSKRWRPLWQGWGGGNGERLCNLRTIASGEEQQRGYEGKNEQNPLQQSRFWVIGADSVAWKKSQLDFSIAPASGRNFLAIR